MIPSMSISRIYDSSKYASKFTTTGSQSRKRIHPVPVFKGTEKEDSYEWLLTFEILMDYHQWDNKQSLSKFMMALQGPADLWWDGKKEELRSSFFKDAKKAFCDFFGGGGLQAQSRALANIDSMKQGSESMVSFGPKLLIEITRITKETHIQLYFFYRIINDVLADRIALAEPESLQEAVAYGVRLEQNAKERRIARLGTFGSGPSGAVNLMLQGTASDNATNIQPMEGVIHGTINAQNQKMFKRFKGNCNHSGKKGHKEADCYDKRKDSHKGRPVKQNTQAVKDNAETEGEEEASNLFERLYFISTQAVVYAINVATHSMEVVYAENPTRFAITTNIRN
ncbi:hypothetical protein BD560DRAFT_429412 [Blakeslea trispora]|nr:hypothetical protein BD560DRAFT_429412 [Blakeslea trispora]